MMIAEMDRQPHQLFRSRHVVHTLNRPDAHVDLVELIGRKFEVDPAQAYWVCHWGAFSFEGAQPNKRKELFLRATFRRTKNQSLGTPSWRVVTREEVEEYTDRQFR